MDCPSTDRILILILVVVLGLGNVLRIAMSSFGRSPPGYAWRGPLQADVRVSAASGAKYWNAHIFSRLILDRMAADSRFGQLSCTMSSSTTKPSSSSVG